MKLTLFFSARLAALVFIGCAVVALTALFGPAVPVALAIGAIFVASLRMATRVPRRPYFPALLLALLLFAPAAFADGTTVNVGGFWSALEPYIASAVAAVVATLGGWGVALLNKKLGLSIDDSLRQSLQTAVTNAAGLVLHQLDNKLAGVTIDVRNEMAAAAVNYVLAAAPDAVKHFGLTPDAIAEKIKAALPQVANTTTTAASA